VQRRGCGNHDKRGDQIAEDRAGERIAAGGGYAFREELRWPISTAKPGDPRTSQAFGHRTFS
jgi:hypothetical protein